MILRPPRALPSFDTLYADLRITGATPQVLAKYLGVSLSTVYRWMAGVEPPRPALLAMYWISQWGLSELDAELFNRAQLLQGLADARAREVRKLHEVIARLSSLGSFGAANDPTTYVPALSSEFPPRPSFAEPLPDLVPVRATLSAAV